MFQHVFKGNPNRAENGQFTTAHLASAGKAKGKATGGGAYSPVHAAGTADAAIGVVSDKKKRGTPGLSAGPAKITPKTAGSQALTLGLR